MGNATYWIEKLNLQAHPEGGFFAESYRANLTLSASSLPASYGGERVASTAIYFLITEAAFSALHKVSSDEGWHYYTGNSPIYLTIISPEGELTEVVLGPDVASGQQFQYVVPAEHWFAAEVKGSQDGAEGFALVGCTVAPGFDFDDFKLGKRADLIDSFPQHQQLIERLTRS
ncbi:MAG: cupin domain-containing protein [Bacteroidota bacterium]